MRFFGFDSFAGLPEPRGVDITPDRHFYEGQFACSKAEVERNLDAKGADWEKTFLIEGFFSDSLTPETRRKYGMKRVALALIDCDLYESTGQVLEFLEPILDDGTVLLFDDWNAFDASDAKGRRRAFREFLEAERWAAEPLLAYGHYGQVFAMRRKEPTAPPERGGVPVRLDYGRVEAGARGRMAGHQRNRLYDPCRGPRRRRRLLRDRLRRPRRPIRAAVHDQRFELAR